MERPNRMLIEEIKGEVMAQLRKSQGDRYQNRGYQAYCQLVDAVKRDVVHQLESQSKWRQELNTTTNVHSGFPEQQLTPAEMDQIKREVLRDLQLEMEGESQRITMEQ